MGRWFIGALVLGACVSLARGDDPAKSERDKRIDRFIAQCEEARRDAIKQWPQTLKNAQKEVTRATLATVGDKVPPSRDGYHFDTREERDDAIASAKESLEKAKALKKQLEENDPPFIRTISTTKALKVGDLGRFPEASIRAQQVIDETNCLGRWFYHERYTEIRRGVPFPVVNDIEQMLWTKGFPTKGVADDDAMPINGCFEVTGTKTYDTAAGSATVLVIEPFDIAPYLKKADASENPKAEPIQTAKPKKAAAK